MGGFSANSKGDVEGGEPEPDLGGTDRDVDTGNTKQSTLDEVAAFEQETEELVDREARREDIEDTLEECGLEQSPYRDAWDEEGPAGAQQSEDAGAGQAAGQAAAGQSEVDASGWTPGETADREPGEPVTEGMDPQARGDAESVSQDGRSYIGDQKAAGKAVGETDDGDTVVATAASVNGVRGSGYRGGRGDFASGEDTSTAAGGVETSWYDRGMVLATGENGGLTDEDINRQVESENLTAAQEQLRRAELQERAERMELSDIEDGYERAIMDGLADGPDSPDDELTGESYEHRELTDGEVTVDPVRKQREEEGRFNTQKIDRDSKTLAGEELMASEFTESERLAENAARLEDELNGTRERAVAEQTAHQATQDRIENEKHQALDSLLPSRSGPNSGSATGKHPRELVINQGRIGNERALYAEEIETYGDLAELSDEEIEDLGLGELDEDIAKGIRGEMRELEEPIEETAAQLSEELEGEFTKSDFKEVLFQGTFDGYTVEEVEEHVREHRGAIPGNSTPQADTPTEAADQYDSTPVRDLSPVRDYDQGETKDDYEHVQVESATVTGEVVEAVPDQNLSDGVYQKFWIEDENGDRTIVTVFKDSIEFPESEFDEDRDGVTRLSDSPWADQDDTGIDARFSTVQPGDTVAVQDVVVDDYKYSGHGRSSDGYTLSTTPSSDIAVVENTRTGTTGTELQVDSATQQSRMDSRWAADTPDPHPVETNNTPFSPPDRQGHASDSDDRSEQETDWEIDTDEIMNR